MRLAQLLFKPKWQDKDASVRRVAVATDADAELIAALPRLLREDPDAGVRLAALKRLNEYEHWRERSTGDSDNSLRRSARAAYLGLLCAQGAAPTIQRRIAELDTLAPDELERVAIQAGDRQLRGAALERVSRQGLLADRVLADPDPQLRLVILERIADAALLERIAERARKTDKNVSRRARERRDAMRISAGDAAAINDKARGLCERVQALMRAPDASIQTELASIDNAWNSLGAAIAPDLLSRYRGARTLALQAHHLLQNPQIATVAEAPAEEDVAETAPIETATASAPPSAEIALALASKARFDAAIAAARAEAVIERERHQASLQEIQGLLPDLAAAIDNGDSAAAQALQARISAGAQALRDVPAQLQRELAPLEARYAQMKQWRHWSNNQRRRALCTEIEALIGSGLHPDALATKVREAREEWQKMDAAEALAGDAEPAGGMSRRFQALCAKALHPAKEYFSKRKEVRKSHGDDIEALLARSAAIANDNSDWKALTTLRQETSAALRALDGVDPRSRTTLAKRLKSAIARIGGLVEKHEGGIEQAKQGLIQEATALAGRGDQANLPRGARELQKRWTELGNGRRSTDQRQWREFRAACDAVFGKLDEARKERENQAEATRREQDARVSATRAQAQELLAEFEAIAQDQLGAIDALKSRLRDLDGRWQAAGVEERGIVQRQREARDAIAVRLKDAARQQRLSRYTTAMQKYTLLRSIENGAPADNVRWAETGVCTAEFEGPLESRYALAVVPQTVGDETDDDARDNLVRLEFLAGIESPSEDRQLRMNHQVRRLSSRMREGLAASPEQELASLLAEWFGRAPQAQALELRFAHAASVAIDALP